MKNHKTAVVLGPVIFFTAALTYFLLLPSSASRPHATPMASTLEFETVPGYFLQDDLETDAPSFDYTKRNFGLKDRDYDIGTNKADDVAVPVTQWQKFERHVANLNSIDEKVKYKVLYLGRHGEGDHNVAERFYGTPAWDAHWSKLDGNGTLYWVDAHLTEKGKTQALDAKAFWKDSITVAKIPAPQSYYTSPLYRCLQTADLTFTGLGLPTDRIFHPTIKEFVREVMGVHTCDKRSTRSLIHKDFPDWTIEPGFTEDDELWQVDHRETSSEHDVRMHKLLADIFSYHTATFISITSHSGSIASTLRVLKHREFRLPTGAIIPVLVKVTKP